MASFAAGKLLKIMGNEDYPMTVLTNYRKVYSDKEHTKTMQAVLQLTIYDIIHYGYYRLMYATRRHDYGPH
jgi:hypothetical protein